MIKTKVNISAQFQHKGHFTGVRMERGRGIAPAYGDALESQMSFAIWESLRAFNRVIKGGIEANTPVWTGWLRANTYSTFSRDVPQIVGLGRVRWAIVANTHYASIVNATPSRRRRANYFGRAISDALPYAMQFARQDFAKSFS